jgi:hypothetical protein
MSHAHYAHIRYLGLNGRIAGENEAPLRLVGDTFGVKCKSFILPITGIDAEGFALVSLLDKAGTALAPTPKTAKGSYDYPALDKVAPAVTDPWDRPELVGLRTSGPKPQPKADPQPKAAVAAAPTTRITIARPTAQPKAAAPQPKAEPAAKGVDREAVIAYLASLGEGEFAGVLDGLKAALAKPAPKAKRGARK